MVPEQTCIEVYLVGALAVNTVEGVKTRFTLFSFEIRGISLKISLVALGKVAVVFGLMGTIVFEAPHTLKMACEGCVAPLPAIFTL